MFPAGDDAVVPARVLGTRAGRGHLRPGAVIRLRAEWNATARRFELTGGGFRLALPTALGSGPFALRAGQSVQVRILTVTPQLKVQFVSEPVGPAPASDGRLGVPAPLDLSDPRIEAVVRVLIAGGRSLEPQAVAFLAARLERGLSIAARLRRARGAVELTERGLTDFRRSSIGELLGWLAGVHGPETGGREDDQPRGTPYGARGRTPTSGLGPYLRRAVDYPDHPVQLFNYLAGSGDLHWIVAPIGASALSGVEDRREPRQVEVTGILRVGVDRSDRRPRKATLSVSVAGGSWWFYWRLDQGTPVLESAESIDGAPQIPSRLLERSGGTVHTISDVPGPGDGFDAAVPGIDDARFDGYG